MSMYSPHWPHPRWASSWPSGQPRWCHPAPCQTLHWWPLPILPHPRCGWPPTWLLGTSLLSHSGWPCLEEREKKRLNHCYKCITPSLTEPTKISSKHWSLISHGSYGVYMAATGSMWLYVQLFFTKIVLHGSYGRAVRKGVTVAFG